MSIMKRVFALLGKRQKAHTNLPPVFMENDEPSSTGFVGSEYRIEGAPGFTDDRKRNEYGYVPYAPRKTIPDLKGKARLVSEDYPFSTARQENPEIVESNVPRQARGLRDDTLTEVHNNQTTFGIAVANFKDTNPSTMQPINPFNAQYPYNHVRETESGHLFEADDTPGSERIKEAHRSGTYYEISAKGSKVEKIVGDNFTVIVKNNRVNIKGSAVVTIEGDCNLLTKGNFTHQVEKDYNVLVGGKYNVDVKDKVAFDFHSDFYQGVGHPVDTGAVSAATEILPIGSGGGNMKIDVRNDYTLQVVGVGSEVYGDAIMLDVPPPLNHVAKHQTIVYGDETNKVIGSSNPLTHAVSMSGGPSSGGMKFDEITANYSESIGGSVTLGIGGQSERSVDGRDVHVIGGSPTILGFTPPMSPAALALGVAAMPIGITQILGFGNIDQTVILGGKNTNVLIGLIRQNCLAFNTTSTAATVIMGGGTTLIQSSGLTWVRGTPVNLN